jgi:hypothetical protein
MATPFPFTAGQVLTAAQLNAITELVINDKTDSYTLVAGDAGEYVVMNKATPSTITVPNSVFAAGQIVRIVNKGAGVCTVTAGAGTTVSSTGTLALAQYATGTLIALSASAFIFEAGGITASSGALTLISATTIGSAVSTVTVSSAFTSTYDNYLITVNGGVASTTTAITIQLGSTTTGYYSAGTYVAYNSSTVTGDNSSNGSSWNLGQGTTNTLDGMMFLRSPNLAKNTHFTALLSRSTTTGVQFQYGGYLADTTQYTAFTVGVGANNMTGGTIRVYGFANS